jgi:glucose-1-phosphate thymidylyltransferase
VKAVVPAAGEGTRLRPLTATKPKGLVDIAGRPLLSYVFDRLVQLDVEEIVVVIGYEGAQIRDHYGQGYRGTPLAYVTQERQAGLAHAVLQAEPHVDSSFIVLNGDNVFGSDLQPILDHQERTGANGTIAVEETSRDRARRTGVVLTGEDDRVTRVLEKPDDPPTTLVTTGWYFLPGAIFEIRDCLQPSERGEFELPDAINELIDAGYRFRAHPYDGWRVNVNAPEDIERVEQCIESRHPSFE